MAMSLNLQEQREQREALMETLKTVENFPKCLSYDAMIPYSTVAFSPGKMIHTNEFFVTNSGTVLLDTNIDSTTPSTTEGAWKSYFETAEILRDRIKALDAQIGRSKQEVEEEYLEPVNNDLSKTKVEKTKKTSQLAQQNHIKSSLKSAVATTAETTKDVNGSSTNGIFEIREFIDDAGNLTSHEVVNLAQQMKEIQQKVNAAMAQSEADKPPSPPSSSSSSSTSATAASSPHSLGMLVYLIYECLTPSHMICTLTINHESAGALASTINQLSMDMEDMDEVDDEEEVEPVDLDDEDDDSDGYDDHESNSNGSSSSTRRKKKPSQPFNEWFAKLDMMEEDEAEWDAAERIREQERVFQEKEKDEREKAALPQASVGGWKKGFLGSSGDGGGGNGSKQKKQTLSTSPLPTPSPSSTTTVASTKKQSVRWSNSTSNSSNSSQAVGNDAAEATIPPHSNLTNAQNKKTLPPAFTGMVMERFP